MERQLTIWDFLEPEISESVRVEASEDYAFFEGCFEAYDAETVADRMAKEADCAA